MTFSMTGFGKSQYTFNEKSISIEIKCLNSKQQDLFVKLPNIYKTKELEIRNLLIEKLIRGKIELFLFVENGNSSSSNKINTALLQDYFNQLKPLLGIEKPSPEILSSLLRLPEVMNNEKEDVSESEWKALFKAIDFALEQVKEFRIQEGENLKKDLLFRLENINLGLQKILDLDKGRIEKMREKLQKSVAEIQENLLDKNRFEQELIYYLEKMDITEEKVRLKSHCDYFLECLDSNGEKGKKLGFVSQEMGREINTIGSKVNDSEMQKVVVNMKDELEKIKEQLLNIL